MPISVRCVLSASEGVQLTKLADIADRILDHSAQSQVMATHNPRSEPSAFSQQAALSSQRKDLLTWTDKSASLLLPSIIYKPP
jgi:hypothetical protein